MKNITIYSVLCITNNGHVVCRKYYKSHYYAIKRLNRYLADPQFSKSRIITTYL